MNYSKALEREKKSIGSLQGRLENGFGRHTVSSLCQKFIIWLRRIQGAGTVLYYMLGLCLTTGLTFVLSQQDGAKEGSPFMLLLKAAYLFCNIKFT